MSIKNMNKITLAVIVIIIIAVGGYFISRSYHGSPASSSSNSPATQNGVISGQASIKIQNFSFSPKNITIKTGTTVTWTNEDSAVHTITSDTNAFNSMNLNRGETFQFQFNNVGTYNYHCGKHPFMTGQIIVQN